MFPPMKKMTRYTVIDDTQSGQELAVMNHSVPVWIPTVAA